METQQLLTVKQFCKEFTWPSEPALRSYIFRAKDLGLEEAFLHIGRRVLVKPGRFFELIEKLSKPVFKKKKKIRS